jgi:ribosomal-protein-alanine N-acetyltransferase
LLAALEAQAFAARSWGAKSIMASFQASGVAVLLGGENDEAPRGFALWRDLGEDAELLTIGVVPEARRRGLGASLLNAVLERAKTAGAEKVYLEVADENPAALALYTGAGFSTIGARKSYYRDGGDAAVMVCSL